jgi:hypothetical protein
MQTKSTWPKDGDATSITPADLAFGILSIDQVAARLGEYFQLGGSREIQVMRLICLESLPASKVSGELRVTLEALKSFLANGGATAAARKAMGLPEETLRPVFPMEGNWFGWIPAWDNRTSGRMGWGEGESG